MPLLVAKNVKMALLGPLHWDGFVQPRVLSLATFKPHQSYVHLRLPRCWLICPEECSLSCPQSLLWSSVLHLALWMRALGRCLCLFSGAMIFEAEVCMFPPAMACTKVSGAQQMMPGTSGVWERSLLGREGCCSWVCVCFLSNL